MHHLRTQLSNAIARKYLLHTHDRDEHDEQVCFFGEGLKEDGWGFWVYSDGTVDVDAESSNGTLPSKRIVDCCVRAAVKFMSR